MFIVAEYHSHPHVLLLLITRMSTMLLSYLVAIVEYTLVGLATASFEDIVTFKRHTTAAIQVEAQLWPSLDMGIVERN